MIDAPMRIIARRTLMNHRRGGDAIVRAGWP